MLNRIYNVFKKAPDLNRRIRAACDNGLHLCESCGASTKLAQLEPLTIFSCPSCGFKGLVPYFLNDYLLYQPLGAGGVSSVYKAVHCNQPRTALAVKLLRNDRAVDENVLRDFLFEAEVHHQVSPHPSIVQFIEQGESNGEYFHVMEFIPGESVKRRVEDSGRITAKMALKWTQEFIGALKHIRQKGYLYRDISPGNLLIRSDNTICLIDFGLALSLEDADSAGQQQPVIGTPEYMPPERVQQLGEDERSTIYSVGMLLIFMIKGEPLIKAGTHERAALQHVSAVRVAFNPSMLPSDCPDKVFQLITRMIKYDPVDRIQTLDDVQAEIGALRLT